MSYDISGWIEVRVVDDCWVPSLCLDAFSLYGCDVSQYLFGLSKGDEPQGLFARRGVPANASKLVRHGYLQDQEFIAKHGEGNFGHTHALYVELIDCLRSEAAPNVDDSLNWRRAFTAIAALAAAVELDHRDLRMIVWANW